MCLAVPAQIISLDGTLAVAEMSGVKKQIDVTLTPEVVPGDWVVVHVGYALQRIDPEKAQEILKNNIKDIIGASGSVEVSKEELQQLIKETAAKYKSEEPDAE